RHALGRRPRVQAGGQADLRHDRSCAAGAVARPQVAPRFGSPGWGYLRGMAPRASSAAKFTVPGMTTGDGTEVAGILQDRLNALNDLALTLKHVHWNV